MPAALAVLILIVLTNYLMIFLSCHGLHSYGAWLNKYHRADLWLHRVLVSTAAPLQQHKHQLCKYPQVFPSISILQIQNGIAIYATWTTIASLLNLTIVLTHDAHMTPTDAATVSLSVLTALVFVW